MGHQISLLLLGHEACNNDMISKIYIEAVAILIIIFQGHMNTLYIIKMRIFFLN